MAKHGHGKWTGVCRWMVLAGLAMVPGVLHADVRSSANYSVEAESFDGGGGMSASATYSNQGSIQPLVTGESSATDYEILHGFVTALTVAELGDTAPGPRPAD